MIKTLFKAFLPDTMAAPAEAPPVTSAPASKLAESVEVMELTDRELDAVAGGAPTTLSGTISVNPYI
jgi:hypothetical protein